MNADVNISNSSENGTQHDDSQQGNSSAKRGITDVENPTEDEDLSMKNSPDRNGNVKPVNEESKNPHKILKREVGGARMFFAMRKMTVTCSVAQNAMGNIITDAQTYHLIKLHYF